MSKSTQHHSGVVTGISSHYDGDGKFVRVEVKHGPKPKKKRGQGAGVGGHYDNRPSSSIVLPKAHASKYHIGQRVGAGITPLSGDEETTEPDETETDAEDNTSPDDAEDSFRSTMRGILRGKSAKKGKPTPKGGK
jgi:hypothetical protein